ncbi:hypothetical protein CY34DRAFT_395477 [Suillus luteus UH-Slu-Lm8-n1]|uniref:Uncharacterized protein n=1 Tax=Suillus luteus UH-Slu-Lm8-n1 TaxID=930992 RepID=A0A0C9ZLL5_9AGAM|nr:hypothetical protein CY34DRAFT_395477 [Suillus luteus UH-Slu-Lm8-n1]
MSTETAHFCNLAKDHPKNRIGNEVLRIRHHQRLKFSWCSRSCVRNTVFKWSHAYRCANSNSNIL